jgi:outer membrane protein OmpA-like peptidoglycan-associated protein
MKIRSFNCLHVFVFLFVNASFHLFAQTQKDTIAENSFGSLEEQLNNFTGTIYYIPENTSQLPDFSKLAPIGEIYTDCLNIPNQDFLIGFPGVTDRFEYFAIDYKGQFYLSDSGYYHFALGSDDGSKLFIDDKLVIDNGLGHSFMTKSATIKINKGVHPIEVQYFQGPKPWVGLVLKYKILNDDKFQLFNLTKFYPIAVEEHDDKIDVSIGNEILFDFNSAKLNSMAKKALTDIKRIIIDKNIVKSITINGYTDDVGSDGYNMKLSLKRADAVNDYFQEIGVNRDLLVTKGFGKSNPKVPNIDEESRRQNRRIEMSIEKASTGNECLDRLKDSITTLNLKKQIANLCNIRIGNRKFATQGERNAACYIRDQFINAGLEGNADGIENYFQEYSFKYDSITRATLQNGKVKANYKSGFIIREHCLMPQNTTLNVVYVGFGLDRPEYSDYTNINVKNKWVLVEANSPIDSAGKMLEKCDFDKAVTEEEMDEKKEVAKKKGALGVIFRINNQNYKDLFAGCYCYSKCRKDLIALNRAQGKFAVIYAKQDAIDSLMGLNSADHNKHINALLRKGNSVLEDIKKQLVLRITKNNHSLNSQNVVGIIKGRQDKVGVFVTAHYDAIKWSDTIFYQGANDNASGTVAVIQLANVFGRLSKTGIMPEKTMVFIAFSGEESMMIGSEHFVKNNPFQTDSTTIDINLDCIGAVDSVNKVHESYAHISTTEKELNQIEDDLYLIGVKQKRPMTLDYYAGVGGSDHVSFINNGIRAVFISTGAGALHTTKDIPESLNYDNYENVTRFAYDVIRHFNQFAKYKKK